MTAVRSRAGLPVAAWLLCLLVLAAPAAARKHASALATTSSVVVASADASVRADQPSSAAGTRQALRVDGAPFARAFVRFRLTGLTGKVVRQASLWVHLSRSEPWAGLTASATNRRNWSERALTWRNRPAVAGATGTARPAVGALWRRIDVTPLVRQDGTVDVVLTTASPAGLLLSSREAGRSLAPRLHLTLARDSQPAFPIRGAFYSAAYPTGWASGTRFHPAAGHYDGASPEVIAKQLASMNWGRINTGIVPWVGPGTATDTRDTELLATAHFLHSPVKWAFSPTSELFGDPSPARIAKLLAALDVEHGRDPSYLRVRGRPVIFVPTETEDSCDAVDRWVRGNATSRFYLVFTAITDYDECTSAPSDWYRTDPTQRVIAIGKSSVVISPGEFEAKSGVPKLNRDLSDWSGAIRLMRASRARFQLVSSYDGWNDGTAIEPATEWASPSGSGQYIDALRANGAVASGPTETVDAAGDVGCGVADQANYGTTHDTCQAAGTANLIESLGPNAVFVIGDDVHSQATLQDFQQGYDPFWGRFKSITYPAPGNHEYCDSRCADPVSAFKAGYLTYWGAQAGPTDQGWYSFDLGSWHIISLNSECQYIGGCAAGSPEETWLRADLAAHPAACTLAYWHRPRFTGGHEGEAPSMGPIWTDLYQAGVELVLNGHQHQYERFLPQSPLRGADPSGGILEIVTGTGGRGHIPPITVRANTVVQNADSFGVTQLKLGPLGYSWQFISAPGLGTFSDAGSGHCH